MKVARFYIEEAKKQYIKKRWDLRIVKAMMKQLDKIELNLWLNK